MGAMTPDSDMDLLVIEPGSINQREESTRLREAIGDLDIPMGIRGTPYIILDRWKR